MKLKLTQEANRFHKFRMSILRTELAKDLPCVAQFGTSKRHAWRQRSTDCTNGRILSMCGILVQETTLEDRTLGWVGGDVTCAHCSRSAAKHWSAGWLP